MTEFFDGDRKLIVPGVYADSFNYRANAGLCDVHFYTVDVCPDKGKWVATGAEGTLTLQNSMMLPDSSRVPEGTINPSTLTRVPRTEVKGLIEKLDKLTTHLSAERNVLKQADDRPTSEPLRAKSTEHLRR